ncbi:TPA: hypothetical protein H1005_00195 [archaeon]|uniref:Uncharacterized protein n=1 Tax=Candidatus Naiadarchaeum limnaeum TaxID=2756139 RepID=A0A832XH33_9ARCH|nr:hypothetical protein [Candidatus Naiadarchaeales archaeon SRR2090153.bin1042]HIK00954.1 hypothetical protein [Candidatus Naiadarchaeum limnaeum]
MESHEVAITIVIIALIGILLYIVVSIISQPSATEKASRAEGVIEAPSPFNPLGKASSFEILINPPKEEICGNFGPRVAF